MNLLALESILIAQLNQLFAGEAVRVLSSSDARADAKGPSRANATSVYVEFAHQRFDYLTDPDDTAAEIRVIQHWWIVPSIPMPPGADGQRARANVGELIDRINNHLRANRPAYPEQSSIHCARWRMIELAAPLYQSGTAHFPLLFETDFIISTGDLA